MKKRILLIGFIIVFCSPSIPGQEAKPDPCDSIKALFDQALVVLDSLTGNQNELQTQLTKTRLEISKSKTEISILLKNSKDATTDLQKAWKLIAEQMDKIKNLEAEVKRLSSPAKSSNKKST